MLGQFFQPILRVGTIPERGSIVVSIDGKTLRGTILLGQTHDVHLVAAFLLETGFTQVQLAVDQKTNAITLVPTLLAGLALTVRAIASQSQAPAPGRLH